MTPPEPGADVSAEGGGAFDRPRLLSPLSIVFGLLVNPMELVPVLVVAFTGLGWWALVIGGGVLALVRALQWSRRTVAFDGRMLTFEEGVVWRSTRRVPSDRLQEVEIVRTLRHRLLGVSSLVVQTAADAGSEEVKLDVLGQQAARRLHDELLASKASPTPETILTDRSPDGADSAAEPPPETRTVGAVLVRLGTARLVLAGLTGIQLLSVGVVAGWLLSIADDVPDELTPDVDPETLALGGVLTMVLVLLAALVVWLLAAAAAAVLMYHGYTVRLVGSDLRLRRGLLDQRETTLPVHRVQLVQVVRNPVRRLLGFWDLRLQTAGSMSEGAARATIPMLRRAERDAVLRVVLPGVDLDTELVPQPPAALPRALVRGSTRGLPGALGLLIAALAAGLPVLVGVAVVVTAVGTLTGYVQHRRRGHVVAGDSLFVRWGWWVRRLAVVPVAKVQSTRAVSSPMQRRRRLATLHVDLAGAAPPPPIVDQRVELVEDLASRLPRRRVAADSGRQP